MVFNNFLFLSNVFPHVAKLFNRFWFLCIKDWFPLVADIESNEPQNELIKIRPLFLLNNKLVDVAIKCAAQVDGEPVVRGRVELLAMEPALGPVSNALDFLAAVLVEHLFNSVMVPLVFTHFCMTWSSFWLVLWVSA